MAGRDGTALHLVLLAGVAVLVVQAAMMTPTSADLLALWLAAQALSDGASQLVYPGDAVFTLQPPAEWVGMADAAGHDAQIFPFIYPPLIAALIVPLTEIMEFAAFARAVLWVNIALALATGWLAWRASDRPMALPVYLIFTTLIFHATAFGAIALEQGQPQILVAFLTVLAIERYHVGRRAWAGAILAVAAAIKVAPALLIVVLVGRRDWRAIAAFALCGATLAGLSILLTGWPLHHTFLSQLSVISRSVVGLPLTFSIDSNIAALLGYERFAIQLTAPAFDGSSSLVGVTEKGPIWSIAGKLALAAALVGLATLAARRYHILLWPVAIIVFALLSPLGWSYHFWAAAAFAPAMIPRIGAVPVILLFLPFAMPLLALPDLGPVLIGWLTPLGMIAMVCLAGAMLITSLNPAPHGMDRTA